MTKEKVGFRDFSPDNKMLVSFLCVCGGFYAGTKRSIVVPLVLAPCAVASCSKLTEHETKRRRYKEILKELERS